MSPLCFTAPCSEALSVFCESPDLPNLAIAIALYCWYCTPQNFSISVMRAKKSLEYLQDLDSTHPPDYQWIPGLTGFLSGLSMGGDRLLHYPSPNIDRETCRTQAHQLFTVWAGINTRPQSNCQGDDAIILAPGILKPRESASATE